MVKIHTLNKLKLLNYKLQVFWLVFSSSNFFWIFFPLLHTCPSVQVSQFISLNVEKCALFLYVDKAICLQEYEFQNRKFSFYLLVHTNQYFFMQNLQSFQTFWQYANRFAASSSTKTKVHLSLSFKICWEVQIMVLVINCFPW